MYIRTRSISMNNISNGYQNNRIAYIPPQPEPIYVGSSRWLMTPNPRVSRYRYPMRVPKSALLPRVGHNAGKVTQTNQKNTSPNASPNASPWNMECWGTFALGLRWACPFHVVCLLFAALLCETNVVSGGIYRIYSVRN